MEIREEVIASCVEDRHKAFVQLHEYSKHNFVDSYKAAQIKRIYQQAYLKAVHENAIVLFRVTDFYEVFFEDAYITSEVLGITMSNRFLIHPVRLPFSGFPAHALDTYLPQLVRAGYRVVIEEE